jgi:hypothetical protein
MPGSRIKRIAEGVFINGLYDLLKIIFGSAVIALGVALWRVVRHVPVDWWGIVALFAFVNAVLVVLIRLQRQQPSESKPGPAASSDTSVEDVFDAEIYRVALSNKLAFAMETQQVFDMMGREFAIDVDVLVELYIVNISERTQYVRDIEASVEIDGLRHPMYRQANFDAFEVNDTDYEYCIDPTPTDNKLRPSERAVGMNAIAPSLPVALESRRPLDGWVHFVVKDVNPKKMENNQTLQFFIVDSMGKKHPVNRPAGKPRANDVVARPKRAVRA